MAPIRRDPNLVSTLSTRPHGKSAYARCDDSAPHNRSQDQLLGEVPLDRRGLNGGEQVELVRKPPPSDARDTNKQPDPRHGGHDVGRMDMALDGMRGHAEGRAPGRSAQAIARPPHQPHTAEGERGDDADAGRDTCGGEGVGGIAPCRG